MKPFKDLLTVSPDDNLTTVKEIFRENRFHHIPVISKHKLVGIISKTDFLKASLATAEAGLVLNNDTLKSIKVKEYMTEKMAKIGPNERVDVAALIFKENLFHCIPIVNDAQELLGVITPFDILTNSFVLTQKY
jgi:acetoin utilization protein AcuB